MVIIDDSLQYLKDLEVDKKKVILSGIVESMGVTYIGEERYSIDPLVWSFEYFVLSRSILLCYNHLRQDFQLTSISTVTKMTSKRKQLYSRSSFSSLAMIIFDLYNLVFGVIMMQTFPSIIFVNCVLHVYAVD